MASESIAPAVVKSIMKEVRELTQNPPEGIKVISNDEDVTDVQAVIEGPAGTPFEGGSFRVKLKLGSDYPQAPPKGFFLTKIFHPNVSNKGEICVNTLKKDWKPDLGIGQLLLTIKCLLIYPNPESALNEEAGKLLLENYDAYAKHATLMTSIHAKKAPSVSEKTIDNASVNNENKDTSNANISNAPKKQATVPAKQAVEKKKSLKRL